MIHTGRTSLKKVGKCWDPDSILRVICNIIVECRELLERVELCTTLHCVPGMAVCFRVVTRNTTVPGTLHIVLFRNETVLGSVVSRSYLDSSAALTFSPRDRVSPGPDEI